jgi:hypothetical protein
MDEPGIDDEWHVRRWVWTLGNDVFHCPRLCDVLDEMHGVHQPIGSSKKEIVSIATRMIVNRQLLLYRAKPSFAVSPEVLGLTEEAESGESAAKVRSTTFIEIVLTDADDHPIAGQSFELVLPDGRTIRPKTNCNGTLRIESVPEGICDFTVSELDEHVWKRAK